MPVASLGLPVKNPPFKPPDYAFVQLAGLTLAKAPWSPREELRCLASMYGSNEIC